MDLPPFPDRGRAVGVRAATAADAPLIAGVQRITWTTAYRDLLPPTVLAGWDDVATTASWAAAVTDPPTPAHRVLVAVDGAELVGLAAVAPADAGPDAAELVALLVEPRWGRRGHGSRLLAAATDLARADGTRRMIMWVPEADPATSGFLASAGWAPDGRARSLAAGTTTVRQLCWHTELDDDRPTAGGGEGAP
ncbi:GNAT family N-acetyltransferase [Modestobacter sp. NPDC049651]|uniref:GNAT family N-acetyltransferase n=1 Tax=unclassified Modestobacter TaxID=2643866 RepID=UPI0033BFC32B